MAPAHEPTRCRRVERPALHQLQRRDEIGLVGSDPAAFLIDQCRERPDDRLDQFGVGQHRAIVSLDAPDGAEQIGIDPGALADRREQCLVPLDRRAARGHPLFGDALVEIGPYRRGEFGLRLDQFRDVRVRRQPSGRPVIHRPADPRRHALSRGTPEEFRKAFGVGRRGDEEECDDKKEFCQAPAETPSPRPGEGRQ